MLSSTQQRVESLLTTIDRLGMVKIKHLQRIHDLKYRNMAQTINRHLKPYINETFFEREKVIYLNKDGRSFIGSDKDSQKPTLIAHTLLRNEVYLHFNCPADWQNEYTLEAQLKPYSGLDAIINSNMKFSNTAKVRADAMFTRNGYVHLIEVDNARDMAENRKKINSYADILPMVRKEHQQTPILYFFTTTDHRKRKFEEWLKGRSIRHEVKTFNEIK
ncbi:hypothetical protein [Bacillus sp. NTK034]|uniref:hypothetical protein n=1 Tax=Bacillus sp. NTK034 TaxID=2802176 RepID=UPI001A905D76|nr:hypothetical protein [Bacillus sp. NTK034]MBN8200465.1 hypothetical protein [Bacillus sp. NTK034]